MTPNNANLVCRDLSKSYFLKSDGSRRNIFRRSNSQTVDALLPLNLAAFSGECIGVLGKNGSGKSTLMRLIAGSESPTTGEILVRSMPTLLGVSSAFQLHDSGRTNIELGLLAMGVDPSEIENRTEEVLEWAELTKAADRPLKTYSSGMRARLGFSVATSVPRDMLLVDEALSTGDSTFTEKARERVSSMLEASGTVFIVSHAPGTIESYCNRVIWLHEGELISDSDISLCDAYRSWSVATTHKQTERAESILHSVRSEYTQPKIILDSEATAALDQKLGA